MKAKLNREEAINILQDYLENEIIKLEWFRNIQPEIKGIVFYGSTAKGLNRPDSDLDLLIFVPLAIEEKYTTGEYSYQYQDREINIVLRSIERMRDLAMTHNDPFQAEVFRDCEVLQEKNNELRELISKVLQLK